MNRSPYIFYFSVLLLVTGYSSFAQNLVPNPGFEIYSFCPNDVSQLAKATHWSSPLQHTGTPDYLHTCSTSPLVSVPTNLLGYEPPNTGQAYAGFFLYSSNWREYLSTRLSSPLIANATYQVSYYYSLSDSSGTATNALGFHFSASPVQGLANYLHIPQIPQVVSQQFLDNKDGWVKITSGFVAQGGEQYLTIGNFLSDAQTPKVYITGYPNVNSVYNNISYIYLDDVSVTPLCPQINLGEHKTLCDGTTLLLNASWPEATYQWHDGSTNPTFTVTESGTYWVTVTTNDCVVTDSVTVTATSYPETDLGNDTSVCQGTALLLDATHPGATYKWQNGASSSTISVTQPGLFYVDVSVNQCTTRDSIRVNFRDLPQVYLGNDTTLCLEASLLLSPPQNSGSCLWQDMSTDPEHLVTAPGNYWVTVAKDGCKSTDSIQVSFTDCNVELLMPNIFTPNKDLANDLFLPILQKGIVSGRLMVVNRWGKKVYSGNLLSEFWDGNFKGSECPDGIYYWLLEARDLNNKDLVLRGVVTLMR